MIFMSLIYLRPSYLDLNCQEHAGSRAISLSTHAATGPFGIVGGPYGSRSAKFRSVDGLKGGWISDKVPFVLCNAKYLVHVDLDNRMATKFQP